MTCKKCPLTPHFGCIKEIPQSDLSVTFVGLQGPFKEIELKASGQDKNHQSLSLSHPSHCLPPSPTLSNLAYSFLPPTRKGMWPTPHPTPTGSHMTSTNQQVHCKTPLSPTSQQVSRCILRPLLSLGYKNTRPCARVGSL